MRLLLIFLKEPIPGQVKTRLAADVGDDKAVRYYKALVEVLLRQLQGLNHTRIRFCYAPDDAEEAIRFWLLPIMNASQIPNTSIFHAPSIPSDNKNTQEIDFHAQGGGELGERLDRAFARGFDDGFEQIAVIGTDCPECGARWINAAFARLSNKDNRDAVIGPCPDGGYYLLALKSHHPELFADIPWSSEHVLSATLESAKGIGVTMERLPPLRDIDTIDDWDHIMQTPLASSLKKILKETPSF